jgi:cyclophilin family peptidyl-prolyl cis-trans isomerase
MRSLAPARHPSRATLAAIAILLTPLMLGPCTGCSSKDGSTPTAEIGGSRYNSSTSSSFMPEKPPIDLHPSYRFKTAAGQFTVKLNAEKAPLTVDNFVSYVNAGHYNGTIFQQVFEGFIILAGGYDTRFEMRPTQLSVRNEAHNGLKNKRGTIAMARQPDAIDSATSQFFINVADNASLDYTGDDPEQYGYCVFGEVTEGMDVVDQIAKSQVHNTAQFQNVPVQPIMVESVQLVK